MMRATVIWLLMASMACGEGSDSDAPNAAPARSVDESDGGDLAPVVFESQTAYTEAIFDDDDATSAEQGPPYPIILVHGFSGFTDLGPLEYFFGIIDLYAEQGAYATAPNQPPYQSVQARSAVLAERVDQVLAATGKAKVHLICHSQGGLDCRRLVSRMGYHDRVADIITIATPHRGTPLADAAQAAPPGVLNPAGQLLAWGMGLLEGEPPDDADWNDDTEVASQGFDADMAAAVAAMTEAGALAFNAEHPDHPMVPIFSVAGVSGLDKAEDICVDGLLYPALDDVDVLDALLVGPYSIIAGDLFDPRSNDGIVPTDSMIWGTFLGCVPADHFDQVGQIADFGPGLVSGFDHRVFYLDLLAFLRDLEASESK